MSKVEELKRQLAEAEAEEAGKGPGHYEEYTVVKGDTLSGIAKKYYGDPNKYPKIFEANEGQGANQIRDANRIYPGQVFKIPM